MAYKNLDKKMCQWCGVEFQPNRPDQECCSYSCASKLRWSDPSYKEQVVTKMTQTIRRRYADGYVNPRKGKKLSEEHIAKMKIGMKGRIPWNKGIPRTNEVREMLSRAHKGKIIPQDVRQRTSESMKQAAKQCHFEKHFEHMTDEAKERRARNMSKAAREQNFARHFIVGRTISPNKAESQFICLSRKYTLPFKFSGDGTFWIGRINPDFVECNGRKIAIDIFGDYWHTPLFLGQALDTTRTFNGRKRYAKEYGWELVIIWQSEFDLLDAEERILNKLRKVGLKV